MCSFPLEGRCGHTGLTQTAALQVPSNKQVKPAHKSTLKPGLRHPTPWTLRALQPSENSLMGLPWWTQNSWNLSMWKHCSSLEGAFLAPLHSFLLIFKRCLLNPPIKSFRQKRRVCVYRGDLDFISESFFFWNNFKFREKLQVLNTLYTNLKKKLTFCHV